MSDSEEKDENNLENFFFKLAKSDPEIERNMRKSFYLSRGRSLDCRKDVENEKKYEK